MARRPDIAWVVALLAAAVPWALGLAFVDGVLGWNAGPVGIAFGCAAVVTGGLVWLRWLQSNG